MIQPSSLLEVENLACLKGDRLLFRGLDVNLAPGELLRVSGPNGIGKTSFLRLVTGLALPEAGEVRWAGQPIRRDREAFQTDLLYLGHAAALNDLLTPLENLLFSCTAVGDRVDAARCAEALERIGLKNQLSLPARVLSQGQRRRVGLARLFLFGGRPLWVLDEPFTALDVAAVADLTQALHEHCDAGGIVILTTHQDAPFARPPRELDIGAWAC